MANHSIRLHFLLWTWGCFLLVLCGVFFFATGRAERAVVAEAEMRARTSLDLVAFLLSRQPRPAGEAGLAAFADAIGPHLGFRVTYIVSGKVVADSAIHAAGLDEMEDHADRPEVLQAQTGGFGQDVRRSHTLGRDMVYVARYYPGGEGVPAGIVRLALPVSDLAGKLSWFRGALLAVLAMMFVAGSLAATVLARSMSRSLGAIADVVAAVGQGHFDRRIHIVPARDFAPLARAINILAERVGDHVREIEQQQRRQEAVFESMADGLAILDGSGRIIASNQALRALFPKLDNPSPRSPIEVGMPLCIERALSAYDPETDKPRCLGRFELQNGRVTEVTVAGLSGEADRGGRVATFNDVTEAATMDRIFRDFVIDASHNLRTPLTKMRGFAETARDMLPLPAEGQSGGPDPARALDAAIRAADAMKDIIDDLLAVARDRYAAARAAAAGEVLAALNQALADTAPLLQARGITVRLVDVPDGPLPARAAQVEMTRAFGALFSRIPEAATVDVQLRREEGHVELRFAGLDAPEGFLSGDDMAAAGGEALLDGATPVVRLPLAGT